MDYLYQELTDKIIGLAINLHKHLGPGLLESAYQKCLAYEFSTHNILYKQELVLPIVYKEVKLETGYRLDFIVEDKVIIELKSVEEILPIHEAQLLTYLKLSGKRLGLIINFNQTKLANGIKRIIL